MRVLVVIVVVVVVAAAGCAGGKASGGADSSLTPAPSPTFGDDTGAIQGLVIDEENVPIPGAQVAVLESNASAVADAAGAFTLSELPAGSYRLVGQMLGYESAAKQVTVAAGEVTTATLLLARLAVAEPHVQVDQYTGHLEWGVRVTPAVGGYASGDIVHKFKAEDRPDAIQSFYVEMTWQDTQPLAGGMRLRVEVDGQDNNLEQTFCVIDSRPPGRCEGVENMTKIIDDGNCDADSCSMQWRGFTSTRGTGLPVDFGAMVDQDFTVWVSIFYYGPRPDTYSAMPDA